MNAIPAKIWAEYLPDREMWVAHYSTAYGIKTVTKPGMLVERAGKIHRVKELFPDEISAIKAAADGLCAHFNAIPTRSPKAKVLSVFGEGRNRRVGAR